MDDAKNVKKSNKHKINGRFAGVMVALAISAFVILAVRDRMINGGDMDIMKNADRTIVTVDGQKITLSDMAYCIMREELTIEKMARIYNPESPKDYWNTRNESKLISGEAHKAVLGMVVHDQIFYREALEHNIVLNSEELENLKYVKTDFWEDLFDEQIENMYVSKEEVEEQIDRVALAQKYQRQLAKEMDINYNRLNWDAYDFEPIKKKHKIKVDEKLWTRVRVGEVTLKHTKASSVPIPGKDESEESDNDKE